MSDIWRRILVAVLYTNAGAWWITAAIGSVRGLENDTAAVSAFTYAILSAGIAELLRRPR